MAGRLEYKSGGMFDSFSLEFCKFKINQTGRVTLEQAQQMFGAAPKAANQAQTQIALKDKILITQRICLLWSNL